MRTCFDIAGGVAGANWLNCNSGLACVALSNHKHQPARPTSRRKAVGVYGLPPVGRSAGASLRTDPRCIPTGLEQLEDAVASQQTNQKRHCKGRGEPAGLLGTRVERSRPWPPLLANCWRGTLCPASVQPFAAGRGGLPCRRKSLPSGSSSNTTGPGKPSLCLPCRKVGGALVSQGVKEGPWALPRTASSSTPTPRNLERSTLWVFTGRLPMRTRGKQRLAPSLSCAPVIRSRKPPQTAQQLWTRRRLSQAVRKKQPWALGWFSRRGHSGRYNELAVPGPSWLRKTAL